MLRVKLVPPKTVAGTVVSTLLTVVAVWAAPVREEHVTGGDLDLVWAPGFGVSANMKPLTLDASHPAYANPSGDHTVGCVTNMPPDSGGIVLAATEPGGVADYTWEAWIFTGDGNTRRGLVVRADPSNGFASCYQFVIQAGLFQMNFRKLINGSPTTLGTWFTNTLPGGTPAVNTWHRMKVTALANTFRCFWDGTEVTITPITDGALATGWVGVYNFRFDLGNVPVYFDDLVLTCSSEVAADFQLTPETLNLRSIGRWVTGTIEPAPPALASNVDVASIRINASVSVDAEAPVEYGDSDGDGIADIQVKFPRGEVDLALSEGDAVPVTLSGLVGGACFVGTDHVRVLRPKVLSPLAGEILNGGSAVSVRWEMVPGTATPTVALLSSLDDGTTWSLVATGIQNVGSTDWTVPSVSADVARVAVVQIESSDDTGYLVNGILSVTEPFSISSPVSVSDGPAGLSLHGVGNPSRGSLRVSFSLPRPGTAALDAYDVGGRLVASRRIEGAGQGLQIVTLTEVTATGVYLVRLSQAGHSVTTRLSVVR